MTIISIIITPSTTEILPGIPTSITLNSNIPCLIFYTLDGTVPTTYSPLYMAPIILPGLSSITLNIFATDGIDTSNYITEIYNVIPSETSTIAGNRLPHAAVTNVNECGDSNNFPFGSNSPNPSFQYENTASAGTTVYNEALPAISSGFDANENPAVFSNQDPSYYEFNTVYSTTNFEGEVGPGIGSLPAPVNIDGSQYDTGYNQMISTSADKLFNPKALVIYLDSSNEDPTNPVIINRDYMSLEPLEITRDGNLLLNTGPDTPPTMGGFVNRYYNPRTNEITMAYRDNTTNRWIFSKTPFQSTNPNIGNLSMTVSRNRGDGGDKVFGWYWNMRRVLF